MAEAIRKSATLASTDTAKHGAGHESVSATTGAALRFPRFFSRATVSPYDELQWERRTAAISDAGGKNIFEQKDVEVPVDWSMTATNIVASKYLHGQMGAPERETGVRQLVGRVAETVRDWGVLSGYFASAPDAADRGV